MAVVREGSHQVLLGEEKPSRSSNNKLKNLPSTRQKKAVDQTVNAGYVRGEYVRGEDRLPSCDQCPGVDQVHSHSHLTVCAHTYPLQIADRLNSCTHVHIY